MHADKYIELTALDLQNLQAENFIQLSKSVEELRIEVAQVHELNIELGDNLDARIDELGTTIGSLSDTVSTNAAEAKTYADAKANELWDWLNSWSIDTDLIPELPCIWSCDK